MDLNQMEHFFKCWSFILTHTIHSIIQLMNEPKFDKLHPLWSWYNRTSVCSVHKQICTFADHTHLSKYIFAPAENRFQSNNDHSATTESVNNRLDGRIVNMIIAAASYTMMALCNRIVKRIKFQFLFDRMWYSFHPCHRLIIHMTY